MGILKTEKLVMGRSDKLNNRLPVFGFLSVFVQNRLENRSAYFLVMLRSDTGTDKNNRLPVFRFLTYRPNFFGASLAALARASRSSSQSTLPTSGSRPDDRPATGFTHFTTPTTQSVKE